MQSIQDGPELAKPVAPVEETQRSDIGVLEDLPEGFRWPEQIQRVDREVLGDPKQVPARRIMPAGQVFVELLPADANAPADVGDGVMRPAQQPQIARKILFDGRCCHFLGIASDILDGLNLSLDAVAHKMRRTASSVMNLRS